MKGNYWFLKMEKYFDFSKWTKKMSKNEKPKYSLLTEFFCDDVENLSSQINLKKIFCDCKIFYIFFGEMLKNLIYFYIRKCLEMKLSKN
jgi:hypothetical protein